MKRPCPNPAIRAAGASCEACGEFMFDGPDACLGMIPGVSQACCGHGNTDSAYVYLGPSDGRCAILKGNDALDFFASVKRGVLVQPGRTETTQLAALPERAVPSPPQKR